LLRAVPRRSGLRALRLLLSALRMRFRGAPARALVNLCGGCLSFDLRCLKPALYRGTLRGDALSARTLRCLLVSRIIRGSIGSRPFTALLLRRSECHVLLRVLSSRGVQGEARLGGLRE